MRPKTNLKYDIPHTVVNVVNAYCADYFRRERLIKFNSISGEVLAHYKEINRVIDAALQEVEEGIRMDLLRDIYNHNGYELSPAALCMSKNTYYARKRKFIHDVAKGLFLL